MTDQSESPAAPAESASSPEQPVHKDNDTEVATEPATATDEPPTGESDDNSGATVQRTAREDTPASPVQSKSTDSETTPAPERPDSQQSTPPTRTRDTSTVQRTSDDTERAAPPPSELQAYEEPQATEEPADDREASDDIQRVADSTGQDTVPPPTVGDERSEATSQQPNVSEQTPEAHTRTESNDVTIQRREQEADSVETEPAAPPPQTGIDTDISSETAEPTTDHSHTAGAVDDTATPAPPAEQEHRSSLQRMPEDGSKTPPPADAQEEPAGDEGPQAPSSEPSPPDQLEKQAEGTDVSDVSVSHRKEAGSEPPSGDTIVQRTWDTPETQPIQQPEEPAERPTGTSDTDVAYAGDSSAITEQRESEATPQIRESDDDEPIDQSVSNFEIQTSATDETFQRSHTHDAGTKAAPSPDRSQQTDEPGARERTLEPDPPIRSEEQPAPPSTRRKTSTEIEPSAGESSQVQRQPRDDSTLPGEEDPTVSESEPAPSIESGPGPEAPPRRHDTTASDEKPASVQRTPEQTDDRVGTEPAQDESRTTDTTDEQFVAEPEEAPRSTERETDHANRQMDSQEGHSPSQETPLQRSIEHDTSEETTIQRQSDASPDVPDKYAGDQSSTADSQPDDDTPIRILDDTIPAEPAQHSTADKHMRSEDSSQPSGDVPAPPQKPAVQQADVEPRRHRPKTSQESARVQRTTDDVTTVQGGDILRDEEVASESEPAAHIQRQPDDGSDSSLRDSESTPARRANVEPRSEPASPPEEPASLSEKTIPSGDTTPQAHIQRWRDDAPSDTMPAAEPRPEPPPASKQDQTLTDSAIQRKSGGDVSAPTAVQAEPGPAARTQAPPAPARTAPASFEPDSGQHRRLQRDESDSASIHAISVATDTQYAIRKAPAPGSVSVSPEPPTGGLEQTLVSRAESRSRLPLATRHAIRRKPVSPSDDPGISQPTHVLRRVRTQIEARSRHRDELIQQSHDTHLQPIDDQIDTPMPDVAEASETHPESPVDSRARADMQPAPPVSPPVFTPAEHTPHTTPIQRTPLEFVQRAPPPTGSAARQEPASETTSERDVEERDEEQEINLDRLARDIYPLIKRMIAIERERRPG